MYAKLQEVLSHFVNVIIQPALSASQFWAYVESTQILQIWRLTCLKGQRHSSIVLPRIWSPGSVLGEICLISHHVYSRFFDAS